LELNSVERVPFNMLFALEQDSGIYWFPRIFYRTLCVCVCVRERGRRGLDNRIQKEVTSPRGIVDHLLFPVTLGPPVLPTKFPGFTTVLFFFARTMFFYLFPPNRMKDFPAEGKSSYFHVATAFLINNFRLQ
jgi:hypothetical protein